MSVPTLCRDCGHRDIAWSIKITDSRAITFSGDFIETCRRCGGRAVIQNGTYDFVGDVIAAFRAPGVTRDNLIRFQEIARSVQAGEATVEDAATEIAGLAASLALVWKRTNDNGRALSVLLTVITLYLSLLSSASSDEVAQQQYRNAQQQIEATQSLREVQEKIHAELQKQTAALTARETPPPTKRPKPQASPTRTPVKAGALNRRERRKAAALARRQKP